MNRSIGPRFHAAPLHRLKSSKPGCPGAMSAAVSPSPISRQAAHQGLAKTSALTTPPISVRPLPLRESRWPYACPPPARRRPAPHPAVRSRHNAAPRPVDGHNIDKLRADVAQGVQSVTFAQHRFAVTVRPIFGDPGKPPRKRVPAVRHEVPDAASMNQPDASQHVQTARHVKQTGHCAKDGRASPAERQTRAPRPRARQACPAALPMPRRTLRSGKN